MLYHNYTTWSITVSNILSIFHNIPVKKMTGFSERGRDTATFSGEKISDEQKTSARSYSPIHVFSSLMLPIPKKKFQAVLRKFHDHSQSEMEACPLPPPVAEPPMSETLLIGFCEVIEYSAVSAFSIGTENRRISGISGGLTGDGKRRTDGKTERGRRERSGMRKTGNE